MRKVSFEYFPPRGPIGAQTLRTTVDTLHALAPAYGTVTFGAAGSTIEGTRDLVLELNRGPVPVASHITAVGLGRDALFAYTDQLWEAGVSRLVVLRGDLPPGLSADDVCGPEHFDTAVALVEALLRRHPFDISVAAYPETHPRAVSPEADIDVLKAKQDVGARRAFTQFFFDNGDFFRFRDKAAAAGVTIPIIPGILPILRYRTMLLFADACGARVPAWLKARFPGGDPGRHLAQAARTVRGQVIGLAREGVDDIHIYTLNQAHLAAIAAKTFLAGPSASMDMAAPVSGRQATGRTG